MNLLKTVRRIAVGQGDEAGGWRGRAGLGGVVAVCMVVTALAVTGASSGATGAQFFRSGHSIYNSTLGTVFHVNGETKNVDGQVHVPGAGPNTQVVETDKSGFMLADGSVTEWGKSDLKVSDPLPAPTDERPVGLEAGPAAYAVYREAGSIQRFGQNPVVVSAGGRLGQPVVTTGGTLWVHNIASSQLCQLSLLANRLTCTARLPVGHLGSLTLVGDQAVFVDTTAKEMRSVGDDGFGRVVPLTSLQLSPASIVATNDVAGQVAILDPKKNLLQLVDASALTSAKPPVKPVVKELGPGRFDQIASSGNGVALIDSTHSKLITLDREGKQQAASQIPAPSKNAKAGPDARPGLFRGSDSRLYVDSVGGEHTMVVDDDGQVTQVEVQGPVKKPGDNPKPDQPKPDQPKPDQPKPDQPKPDQPVPTKPVEPPRTTDPVQPENDRPGLPVKPPPDKPSVDKPTVSASRPGAPSKVSATAGTGAATVSWGAAASNGAQITSYVVSWSGGSKTVSGSTRKITATGLTNGTAYTFTVRAVNRVGTGPGASDAATPAAAVSPADAVLSLRAKASSGAVTLSWRRPNLNGGKLVRYGISQNGNAKNTTGTSYKWTGLTNGKTYTFAVVAVTSGPNGVMTGKVATVSATPKAPADQGTLRISQGPRFGGEDETCTEGCYYIHIMVRNFRPNTTYYFQGYTSNFGALHQEGPEPLTTDANGNLTVNKFYNDDTGGEVWVVMSGPDDKTSNRVIWTE